MSRPMPGPDVVTDLTPTVMLGGWLRHLVLAAVMGMLTNAAPAAAATIVVNNINDPGQGFNDPTPVSPVAGNPATTLGAQRLAAFTAAADRWAQTLLVPVTITVDAQMTSLSCSQNSAVLGSAGPSGFIFRDFPGAPFAATWYPQALHNAITATDGDPSRADISANFNPDIGQPGCLQSLGWSYAIGAPPAPGTLSFVDTVLHEIGHGLGFLTFANISTGVFCCTAGSTFPDHFARFLLDETPAPTLWTALTDSGRQSSATDTGNLTWNGPQVADVAATLSGGRHASGRVRLYAPAPLQPGSSVSHFDTALTPNDIMEPSLTATNQKLLANHLLMDIGWNTKVALEVAITDNQTSLAAGSTTTYSITISNNGPAEVTVVNATVVAAAAAALVDVTWTCQGSGNATCASVGGNDSLDTAVTVPLGGRVNIDINAIIDAEFSGTLSQIVTVGMPASMRNTLSVPPDGSSLSATDQSSVSVMQPSAAISLSPISGNTSEAGASAAFSIVLDTQPTSAVSIGLSSSDLTEATVAPTSLNFDSGNWATPQWVTATGVDDAIADGDIVYSIITAPASSGDSGYDNLDAADRTLSNSDDDTAGITLSAISGPSSEAGGSAEFTMVLDSQPLADVTIGLSSSDPSEGMVAPASVVFTPLTWAAPQTVTVTGVADAELDGDVAYSIITAAAVSADLSYQGMDPDDVLVINQHVAPNPPETIFSNSFE